MARRPVRWTRQILRNALWVPLLPLVTAAILLALSQSMRTDAARLDLHGVEALATITDREILERRDRDGSVIRDHRLRLSFTGANGERVETWITASRSLYEASAIGTVRTVRHVAHDPTTFELEPGSTASGARVFGWVALATGAGALILAAILGRNLPSLRRAARDGEIREAQVTEHLRSSVRVNGRPRWRMRWVDAAGATGTSGLARAEALPPVGSVIVVQVDPRTGRGWWQEDL